MDWETCFHCNARRPVSRSGPKRALDAMAAFIVVGTLGTMAVRLGNAMSVMRVSPERLILEMVRTASAAPPPASAEAPDERRAPWAPGAPVSARVDLAATAARARSGPALATVSEVGDSVPTSPPVESDSAARAARAAREFEEARMARAIGATGSVAALDSLEELLRAEHPRDPALREGGTLWRAIARHRAVLARR